MWKRALQPTPVLPGDPHGKRRLTDYRPYSCQESDTTEQLSRGRTWPGGPASPLCPSLAARRIRGTSSGCPTSSHLDLEEAEETLCCRVTKGWKLAVTKPFHIGVLARLPPRSCSWGPGNYLSVLFLLNPDGSIFFLILGASLPLNFSSSLKDSRVYFCAFQQRVWLINSEKADGVAQCPMVSQWRNKLAPWLELSKLASQGRELNTLLLLLFVFKRAL